MNINAKIEWNNRVKNGLLIIPDKVLFKVARQTLDLSKPLIPYDSGKLEKSSFSNGVRKSITGYYIGSFTNYASRVWDFPETTNWTTKTHPKATNKWFARTLKEKQDVILKNAVNQSWRETL